MNMVLKDFLMLGPETGGSEAKCVDIIMRMTDSQGSYSALGFLSPGLSQPCSGKCSFPQVE